MFSTDELRVSVICIALITASGSPVAALAQQKEHDEHRDNGPITAEGLAERVLDANLGLASAAAAADAAAYRIEPAGSLDDPVLSYAAAPATIGVGEIQSENGVQPADTLARHVARPGSCSAV